MAEHVIRADIREATRVEGKDDVPIYSGRAPADAPLPHVVVTEQGTTSERGLDGSTCPIEVYYQVEARSVSAVAAMALRDAIVEMMLRNGHLKNLMNQYAVDDETHHEARFHGYVATVSVDGEGV